MMLILISFWGLSTYQRDAFRKAYGLSEQVDLFNSNSTQVFNRLTRSSQEEIRRQMRTPSGRAPTKIDYPIDRNSRY